jgi:hypothetical protein
MGLLKNLSLLFSDSVLNRMTELEQRQSLLEEYTEQRLDSMKVFHARVVKRDRDAAAPANDRRQPNGQTHPMLQKLLERRARRHGAPQ